MLGSVIVEKYDPRIIYTRTREIVNAYIDDMINYATVLRGNTTIDVYYSNNRIVLVYNYGDYFKIVILDTDEPLKVLYNNLDDLVRLFS
ncbi:MAG: hypothetical protein GXO26_06760 [Crenarchaeota archaeon]|nr:hypothetical protein [Thermoproteota archaeon]